MPITIVLKLRTMTPVVRVKVEKQDISSKSVSLKEDMGVSSSSMSHMRCKDGGLNNVSLISQLLSEII